MFGLLNKDLVKPILAQLETLNEKHKFNLSELITLQTYLGRFKQIKEVRSDGLVKIGMWTNKAIDKASDKETDLTREGLPPL